MTRPTVALAPAVVRAPVPHPTSETRRASERLDPGDNGERRRLDDVLGCRPHHSSAGIYG